MNTGKLEDTVLSSLRKRNGATKQSVVAMEMSLQESAVSKFERKRIKEASLQKLKSYVKAIGGRLEVTITLQDGSVLHLEG
jgi:predicted XRE-type DNA-binding protein